MSPLWNVPNILTYFRLLLVPLFGVAFGMTAYVTALLLFFLAGFTDLIDGAIARRLNQRSTIGAILDPIADKTLMWAAFICLATVRVIPWWFVWLMIVKDMIVVAGVLYLKWRKIPFAYEPVTVSKAATLCQIVMGTFGMIDFTFPGQAFGVYPVSDFVVGGIYLSALLIVLTTVVYIQRGLEILQKFQKAA